MTSVAWEKSRNVRCYEFHSLVTLLKCFILYVSNHHFQELNLFIDWKDKKYGKLSDLNSTIIIGMAYTEPVQFIAIKLLFLKPLILATRQLCHYVVTNYFTLLWLIVDQKPILNVQLEY